MSAMIFSSPPPPIQYPAPSFPDLLLYHVPPFPSKLTAVVSASPFSRGACLPQCLPWFSVCLPILLSPFLFPTKVNTLLIRCIKLFSKLKFKSLLTSPYSHTSIIQCIKWNETVMCYNFRDMTSNYNLEIHCDLLFYVLDFLSILFIHGLIIFSVPGRLSFTVDLWPYLFNGLDFLSVLFIHGFSIFSIPR